MSRFRIYSTKQGYIIKNLNTFIIIWYSFFLGGGEANNEWKNIKLLVNLKHSKLEFVREKKYFLILFLLGTWIGRKIAASNWKRKGIKPTEWYACCWKQCLKSWS